MRIALSKNKDYDLILTILYLYYVMKLVTFGIDNQRYLIVQFPVFVQPYAQRRLVMYHIETVPVPILDRNDQAQSYSQLKIDKPYIMSKHRNLYTLLSQELSPCRIIGYEYYCEELSIVKSKSRYSCTCAMYFNLGPQIIKEYCEFDFHFNKTDVKPTVLHIAHQIILANWPSDK